ncbi:hypothetical protein [Paenibacillus sp. GXUN7292]|uniref:hypothetical protein n=1 Tax=Paenibacillus sp. GXUN7292 TaxID=3422499 RepID=UPI003D7C7FC6
MSNNLHRAIIGFFYGIILSLICSFFITLVANASAGVFTVKGWFWFFFGLCVPLSITFGITGYFLTFKNLSMLKFWLLCVIFGFINVLYMGTVGAILGSAITYGLKNINVGGYFAWGPIYAAIFLPLSTLVVAGLIMGLRNVLENKKLLKTE